MHGLIQSAIVKLLPHTYTAQRIRRNRADLEEAHKKLITADMIEKAIVRGTYNDNLLLMCIAIRNLDESLEQKRIARTMIMREISPQTFLVAKLHHEGEFDYNEPCKFTQRIQLSNWYWSYIRELRKEAQATIEMIEYYGVR